LGAATAVLSFTDVNGKVVTLNWDVTIVDAATDLTAVESIALVSGTVSSSVEYKGTLNTSNVAITATLADGTTESVTASDLTISAIDTSVLGATSITIAYGGVSITHNVTVSATTSQQAAYATAIELTTAPASTVNRLATLDTSAVVAKVTYLDDSAASFIYSDLAISDADTDTIGTKSITISYTDTYGNVVTCSHSYEVVALASETAASITVTSGTLANKVAQNDTLDTTNADIKVVYADGSSSAQTVTVALDSSILGEATAVLSFTDVNGKVVTLNWDVTIVDAATDLTAVESIALVSGTLANTIDYASTLNTEKIEVIATLANSTTTTLTESDLTFTGLDAYDYNGTSLTITYGGVSITHDVSVEVSSYQSNRIVKTISVTEGTVPSKVVVGGTLLTSNLTIDIVYYSDLKTTLPSGFVIGEIDTDEVGSKTFDVSYTDAYGNVVTTQVPYEVVTAGSLVSVTSLESVLITDFVANSTLSSDNNAGFLSDDNTVLYAGDYNDFHFRAVAYGLDSNNNLLAYTMSQIETSVSIKIDGVELTASQLATYFDDIDYSNVTFNFSEQALGKTFTITVTATTSNGNSGNASFDTEVTVMEGYNLYEAYELSLYDNRNSFSGDEDTWTAFKTYYGINDIDVDEISNFILQADLVITMDDIAKSLLWSDGTLVDELGNTIAKTDNYDAAVKVTDATLLGTLRDVNGNGIYNRDMTSDEEVVIEGNYFTIDASNISLMVVENGETNGITGTTTADSSDDNAITTHTAMFYHSYETPESGDIYETVEGVSVNDGAQVTWTNLGLTGNAPNNGSVYNSGGLIAVKANTVSFSAINNITNYFYIAYFFNRNAGDYLDYRENSETYILDSCKMLNTYQNTLYVQFVKELLIMDSIIDGCGGPAIISDSNFWDADTTTDDYTGTVDLLFACTINVINSEITTTLSGNEPWFVTYNASSLVTQVASANALFDDTYASAGLGDTGYRLTQDIEGTGYLNVICVFKRYGEMSVGGGGSDPVGGTYTEYASWADYKAGTTSYHGTNIDSTAANADTSYSSIMFESTATGGYISSGVATNGIISYSTYYQQGTPYFGDGNVNVYIPAYGFMVVLEMFAV
ncbi:MAG: bacterial Ig-like domain-containing protein, partial [Bacillota bacterium]